MEKKIFIELLKYGEKKGLSGLTSLELEDWATRNGFIDKTDGDENQKSKKNAIMNLFMECFAPSGCDRKDSNLGSSNIRVLKNEYYFRLIEHQELQASRRAAKSANRNAFVAIGISVAAIIVSAFLTFTHLNTPIRINKSDLTTLINAGKSTPVQPEVKFSSRQMEQILSAIEQINPVKRKYHTIPSNEIKHHELINRYFENE